MRGNGELDEGKNLIEKRQASQECSRWKRARDGTKKGERKPEGKASVSVQWHEALTYKDSIDGLCLPTLHFPGRCRELDT